MDDQQVAGQVEVTAHIGQREGEQRQERDRQAVAAQLTPPVEAAVHPRQAAAAADVGVRHHVHVDVAGVAHRPRADAWAR